MILALLACTCARPDAIATDVPVAPKVLTVADDPVLAEAPRPVERLELSQALWGVSVPNSVKGLPIAYDATTDRLYHSSIASNYLVATDLEKGHPVAAVDLDLAGTTNIANVQARDGVLSWVNSKAHEVRVVDLRTMTVQGRVEVDPSTRQKGVPTSSCAMGSDQMTWVVNSDAGTVSGHDPRCAQTVTLDGVDQPRAVATSPDGQVVALLQGGREGGTASLVRDGEVTPVHTIAGRLPKRMAVTNEGTVLLADRRLVSVPQEGEGIQLALPETPRRMAVVDDLVILSFADIGFERGRPGGEAWLVEYKTGTVRARLQTGYETLNIATDAEGDRAWVAHGGDGSVSEIDLKRGEVTRVLKIAAAAEGLVVDPKTGTRYVLSRLGGSFVYAWGTDGSLETLAQPAWPFELAIDPDRRILMAATHYHAGLTTWDLDSGKETVLPLPIEISTGDAIGDLAYEASSGLAAVVHPEHGSVTLVDVTTGAVAWSQTFEEFATGPDAGPGSGLVAFTPKHVVVAFGKQTVLALDRATGQERLRQDLAGRARGDRPARTEDERPPRAEGERPPRGEGERPPRAEGDRPPRSGEGRPPRDGVTPKGTKADRPPKGQRARAEGAKGSKTGGKASGSTGAKGAKAAPSGGDVEARPSRGYPLDALQYDAVSDRLFMAGKVLDAATLEPVGQAPFDLLIHSEDGRVLGAKLDRDKRELLLICDADLNVVETVPLMQSRTMPAHFTYDAATRRLYAASLDRAQVVVWQLD